MEQQNYKVTLGNQPSNTHSKLPRQPNHLFKAKFPEMDWKFQILIKPLLPKFSQPSNIPSLTKPTKYIQ